jgi:cystathionine beta-lyase
MSDFDQIHERQDDNSVKWDKYKGSEILPMWVADMDFRSPSMVIDAIKQKADDGILAYGNPPKALSEVFVDLVAETYDWKICEEQLIYINGIVPALNMACRALVGENEALITAVPTYTPILEVGENNNRYLHKIKAVQDEDGWHYPLAALSTALENNPEIRMLLLCNPFNPIGRSLTEEELTEIVGLCHKHHVWICSDEIHCDLIFDHYKHIPIASLSELAESITITLMAPTKTYNLAGVGGSIVIIKDEAIRERFTRAQRGMSVDVSSLGYVAMLAAYRDCKAWKFELMNYLQANRDYLMSRMTKIEGIEMNRVEGTYLAWLDVRNLGLNDPQNFFETAGVGMSPGSQYEGPGFMRLNFACPRKLLIEACDRIERAIFERPPIGGSPL